jgi:thermitase
MKKRLGLKPAVFGWLIGSSIGLGFLLNPVSVYAVESAPGEVIVQLKSSAPRAFDNGFVASTPASNSDFRVSQISSIIETFNRDLHQQILDVRPFTSNPSMLVLRVADDSSEGMSQAIAKLKALPEVKSAELNQIVHIFVSDSLSNSQSNLEGQLRDATLEQVCSQVSDQTYSRRISAPDQTTCVHAISSGGNAPNDPDFSKTWAFQNTGQIDPAGQKGIAGADIGILPLWNAGITGSRKVLVAVLDTGIDLTHPDLQANIYTNPGEIAGNGIDDDHNGFIDDVHGWNFYDNNNNTQDDNDHGTHVSGIIGAIGNNGVGIAGVNWNVSLLPVKFLGKDGSGYLAGAIEAINYATLMKAQVINMSSGVGEFSQAMSDAIAAAQKAGILFVAAAGNTGVDADSSPSYPASYALPNVMSVAATDNEDHLASFSDYGIQTVHLAAPGADIYSTVIGGQYATYSGTSMAAPLVSGVAALLLSQEPTLSVSDIKDRLMKSSDPLPSLHRKVVSQGRLNAYNALHSIYPPSADPDPSLWQDVTDDVESPHPYLNDANISFTVQHKGARYLRLHFQKIDTELYYDTIVVTDPSGKVLEKLSGQLNDYTTDYVEGDTLHIQFTSDHTTNGYGFLIDKIQVIE